LFRRARVSSVNFLLLLLLVSSVSCWGISAEISNDPVNDQQRQTAIADFTARTKAANYPALFDQAAQEFGVPSDILKGIAFAETRWEHLTWPSGETVSPETGMPRPYGIMSLWDNNYFGHSLIEAANLLGKSPDDLKADPFQNIRGAAAFLRKIYDQTPKPPNTPEKSLESWRYAIRKYCGIPEPDLNAQHALKVYTFISQGYHQFGIEWDAHPVDLRPLQEETKQIIEHEQQKRGVAQTSSAATLGTPRVLASTNHKSNPAANLDDSLHPIDRTNSTAGLSASVSRWRIIPWLAAAVILLGVLAAILFLLVRNYRANHPSA